MERLLDSVPPDVNTTWEGTQPSSDATSSRARSTASWASCPMACPLEGLPKWSRQKGNIRSTTSGRTGVVALWSR